MDLMGSDATSAKLLGFSSRWLGLGMVVSLLAARLKQEKVLLGSVLKVNNWLVLPVGLSLGIGLSLWDLITPDNFVYALTRIQYVQLFLIGVIALCVALVGQSNKWHRHNYSKLVFWSAFFIFGSKVLVDIWPFNIFAEISGENGLLENTQFVVLMMGAVVAILVAYGFWKKMVWAHSCVFTLASLGLVLVAGDEVSWGQQWFGWQTPENLEQINLQGETTWHNLEGIHNKIELGYLVLSAYGAFGWLVKRFVSVLQKPLFDLYIPTKATGGYFLAGFAYNYYARFFENFYGAWAEYMELMIYLGVAMALVLILTRLKMGLIKISET